MNVILQDEYRYHENFGVLTVDCCDFLKVSKVLQRLRDEMDGMNWDFDMLLERLPKEWKASFEYAQEVRL